MNSRQPQAIRLVIADDHAIVRDGLRRLLEEMSNYRVIGEASDGAETLKLTRQLKPDILLLDLKMPEDQEGLEALRELSTSADATRVILLTAQIEKEQIVEALQLGARGIVLKHSATQVLLEAIQAVMAGEYWVYRERVLNMMKYLLTMMESTRVEVERKKFGLTPRELDVVSAVVASYSNKEIAECFEITEDTVKHHLSNIYNKLGVYTRLELALFAVHHKLPLKDVSSAEKTRKP